MFSCGSVSLVLCPRFNQIHFLAHCQEIWYVIHKMNHIPTFLHNNYYCHNINELAEGTSLLMGCQIY